MEGNEMKTRIARRSTFSALLAGCVTLVVTAAASAQLPEDPLKLSFDQPVGVTQSRADQAAEPSIRVDAPDPNQRIWIGAPSGIGVNARMIPAAQAENGDLFWYSDDDGGTWTRVDDATIVGGGDTDIATHFGPEVYGTGLTLANITLTASCDNGQTWHPNFISNLGAVEDRQWIDTWEDKVAPFGAPEFVLNYGGPVERRMYFHQVASPMCVPPLAGARLDVSHPECVTGLEIDCYQWPGNLAVDETTGDVYVTHNTLGNDDPPHADDVVVARVDGGASRPVTQADVHSVVAANDRPDTFDSFTVVAVDKAGNVYVVWTERRPETQTTDTFLAVSKTRGMSWSKPIKVNRGPRTTTFPWIVAGDAGKIDIVYYGTSEKGPSPEDVSASSKWRVWMAQSLNALDRNPSFKENPATGFMHQGPICTSGTGCAPGTRDLLDLFQIDVDRRGMANIAYTDNLNTPPDGSDPHQEWVTFVQQKGGKGIIGR
jgi:hypothetical protein